MRTTPIKIFIVVLALFMVVASHTWYVYQKIHHSNKSQPEEDYEEKKEYSNEELDYLIYGRRPEIVESSRCSSGDYCEELITYTLYKGIEDSTTCFELGGIYNSYYSGWEMRTECIHKPAEGMCITQNHVERCE